MGGPKRRPPLIAAAVVAIVGGLLTAVLVVAAAAAHRDNEVRLLERRADQAAAVLRAAVPSIEVSLATTVGVAAEVQAGAGSDLLAATLGTQVGPEARFRSAAVWMEDSAAPSQVLGEDPALLARGSDEIDAVVERALDADTMVVVDLLDAEVPTLGYALGASDGSKLVVYVEQQLQGDRTRVQQSDDAFSDIDYALYLGSERIPDRLLAASVDEIPLRGQLARSTTPFGDTELLLVVRAHDELGGDLLRRLPWLVLLVGLLNTAGGALGAHRLQRRRLVAEDLAEENARLYLEQHGSSVALQRSLLPGALPDVTGVEIVARYRAGVSGTQVGGDWYDAVATERGLIAIVGDVSGRGLPAVSVMASARHATRAIASLEDSPGVVLGRVSEVERDETDGHFVTVGCVAVDVTAHEVTVALAGHPRPLVVGDGTAAFVDARVGLPIGVGEPTTYDTVTASVPPGGTVVLFTDGLFERRDETVDEGMERLRRAAILQTGPLDQWVDELMGQLLDGQLTDDTAILAIRWSE